MSKTDNSFVVVSDFHSHEWTLDKVENHYINEYGKVYILGDATDRGEYGDGTGGIRLFLKIKNLTEKYPGRIIYVPGNHDEFLYGYAKYDDNYLYLGLYYNHGVQTKRDIDDLKKKDCKEFNSLMDWLGNLPLQREEFYHGERYVLAHALFDDVLFNENKSFSLEDYRKEGGNYGPHKYILWFRNNNICNSKVLPKEKPIRTTMIIGHTPLCYREGDSLDLSNADGDLVPVICVDGGVSYDGRMLKYPVSDFESIGIKQTFKGDHKMIPQKNVLMSSLKRL